ncbi:MAG: hypothetical protein ACKOW8_03765 [Flavobacteriales bacterium]
MNKRQSRIYLSLAPILFGLSWYISHRMYTDFLKSGQSSNGFHGENHAILYATVFTSVYLLAYFIINDLYDGKAKI